MPPTFLIWSSICPEGDDLLFHKGDSHSQIGTKMCFFFGCVKKTQHQTSFPPKTQGHLSLVLSFVCLSQNFNLLYLHWEQMNERPQEQSFNSVGRVSVSFLETHQVWVSEAFLIPDSVLLLLLLLLLFYNRPGEGFKKIECKKKSFRFQIVDFQTVYTSQFSKAALTQWVSKVLLF